LPFGQISLFINELALRAGIYIIYIYIIIYIYKYIYDELPNEVIINRRHYLSGPAPPSQISYDEYTVAAWPYTVMLEVETMRKRTSHMPGLRK